MTVRNAERIAASRDFLLRFLKQNPKASKIDAQRWLNNQRWHGERLTLQFDELGRIFAEVRGAVPFNPPRIIVPKLPPLPPEPPKAVPIQVAAPGTLEKTTRFFIPGQPERKQYAETLALENPKKGSDWIRLEVKKKFGVGLDVKLIQSALETSRVLAGMKAKLRSPKVAEAPPITEEPSPMPLPDPPPPPLKPDALLREAAGVLKILVEKMAWERLAITIDHKGEITYDATPLPVLAAKGSLRL